MKEKTEYDERSADKFDSLKELFLKWVTVFYRFGLRPSRFFKDRDAIYFCTNEGWFRLSLIKYAKEELNWLQSILQYLEERSFNNWACSWRNTIIWEEESYSYLIQPWVFTNKKLDINDPASIRRVSEIIAKLYRCGKDYHATKGIGIFRDRWSTIELQWEQELKAIESLTEELFHEKLRKEIHILKKEAVALLSDCLTIWKNSMNTLFEHHFSSGVIGHGRLRSNYIIWKEYDYYLLNWENLSFQPKVADLASLINDTAIWEPEWISFLINEYSKNQSFWPEEYNALKAMLQYPGKLVKLLSRENIDDCDYKQIKVAKKELKRKDRCLAQVWRELGTDNCWSRGRVFAGTGINDNGKISLILSPIHTWGGFQTLQAGPLINLKPEQKLPNDIWDRLVNNTPDRVFGGGDGQIMEVTSNKSILNEDALNQSTGEREPETINDLSKEINETVDELEVKNENHESTIDEVNKTIESDNNAKDQGILNWSNFPKPLGKVRN